MTAGKPIVFVLIWLATLTLFFTFVSNRPTIAQSKRIVVPKIWDAKELSDWATPVAGLNATPNFYKEDEYYSAPVDNFRTYPVYDPDHEPKNYLEWIRKQGSAPMIEPAKLKTEKDWIEAGRIVFESLDIPITRSNDPQMFKYLHDREAIKRDNLDVSKDGIIPIFRYVVDNSGEVKVGLAECSSCHTRKMADGTLLRGAQGNLNFASEGLALLVDGFIKDSEKRGISLAQSEYYAYAVPWIKDDIHQKLKTMTTDQINEIDGVPMPGIFIRFNGSPYYATRIPDLIGVKDRIYLDATATHKNRGPADIARYAALVATADDGSYGPHKFLTEEQRRLPSRFSDEALFALGMYVYSLEPPSNPNKFDDLAARGKQVFEEKNCWVCHSAPLYTNNMLVLADGFQPPRNDPTTQDLRVLNISIGVDPNLALKTRKGTGYYRVPSLKGLWYRNLLEHSGSVASLEDWFDPKRLRDDYVPSGWKGPGVKTRAVKGHEYGLNLSDGDKKALIAFLKTL